MTAIEARFMSTCPACDGAIYMGDRIVPDPLDGAGTTWVHEKCPAGLPGVVRTVCSDCFTEVSVSGACLCGAT